MINKIGQNYVLKVSIAIIYIWFGALKFFPQLSPAEELAIDTIEKLTFGIIPSQIAIILLALWEVGIGLFLLLNILPRMTAFVTLFHLACTFTPLFFFNELSYNGNPIFLTLLGQYIIKNLIIAAALISIIKSSYPSQQQLKKPNT